MKRTVVFWCSAAGIFLMILIFPVYGGAQSDPLGTLGEFEGDPAWTFESVAYTSSLLGGTGQEGFFSVLCGENNTGTEEWWAGTFDTGADPGGQDAHNGEIYSSYGADKFTPLYDGVDGITESLYRMVEADGVVVGGTEMHGKVLYFPKDGAANLVEGEIGNTTDYGYIFGLTEVEYDKDGDLEPEKYVLAAANEKHVTPDGWTCCDGGHLYYSPSDQILWQARGRIGTDSEVRELIVYNDKLIAIANGGRGGTSHTIYWTTLEEVFSGGSINWRSGWTSEEDRPIAGTVHRYNDTDYLYFTTKHTSDGHYPKIFRVRLSYPFFMKVPLQVLGGLTSDPNPLVQYFGDIVVGGDGVLCASTTRHWKGNERFRPSFVLRSETGWWANWKPIQVDLYPEAFALDSQTVDEETGEWYLLKGTKYSPAFDLGDGAVMKITKVQTP